jgi:DNA-binding NtrC family response regulator
VRSQPSRRHASTSRGGEPGRILVADDEKLMNDFLKEILTRKGFTVDQAFDGDAAVAMLHGSTYDLVLSDKKMPGGDGMDVLKAALRLQPQARVIMMTAYGSVESAVESMRIGAFDYVMKPFDADRLEEVVDRALSPGGDKHSPGHHSANIVGSSDRMREVLELVGVVAPTGSTVIITGGTGKELVAREIQRLSKRHDKPFVRLNCAALPDGLIESELFGHEKGAFTGAVKTRRGKFELADGGTMLLDEIGEIGINMQAKVLRVLQEKEFERIGAHETRTVDVRIVATTNKDLKAETGAGRFREDLYYRLNVFPINLPPLRERKEDIPVLTGHFIHAYRGLCNSRIRGIADDAMAVLMAHDWPGNVRELENCIERALIVGQGDLITREDIVPPASLARKGRLNLDPGTSLREMEKMLILKTLEATGWNRTAAARKLGVSTRTLRNKLKIYREEDISSTPEEMSMPDPGDGRLVSAR